MTSTFSAVAYTTPCNCRWWKNAVVIVIIVSCRLLRISVLAKPSAMVNQRQFLSPVKVKYSSFSRFLNWLKWLQPYHSAFIRSRLYSSYDANPRNILVHSRISPSPRGPRYPCVEDVLDSSLIQSHIHDCFLRLSVHRHEVLFQIFFKRHVRLPRNKMLSIKGDLLIMRVSMKNKGSVVNLRSSDVPLLDRSMQR